MNNFIDIHNHVLPMIDDGSNSLEEAVDSINYLKKLGYYDIVLTSHYIIDSKYNASIFKRQSILEELKKQVTGVNLYLGNEVYISDSNTILDLLKKREISTLNNSRYLLLELPFNNELRGLEEIICELNEARIVPVIAHPERYTYFQQDYNKLTKLLEYNCLFQCNITSIMGRYGSNAKKLFKKMLKTNMIHFLATDFHHRRNDDLYLKSILKVKKKIGDEKFRKLTYNNPKSVLENSEVK